MYRGAHHFQSSATATWHDVSWRHHFAVQRLQLCGKAQCAEHGTTGMREAIIFDAMLASGQIKPEDFARAEKTGTVPGWTQDPYDSTIKWSVLRNLSEDEQYDAQFPNHPLSRIRSLLHSVQSSL